jgi:hypothetical protein
VVLARGGEGELARRPKKPVLAGAGAGCTAGAGSLWPKRPMVVVGVAVREGMGISVVKRESRGRKLVMVMEIQDSRFKIQDSR